MQQRAAAALNAFLILARSTPLSSRSTTSCG